MLYKELKDKKMDVESFFICCERTFNTLIQTFNNILPEDKQAIELLKDMKKIIPENFAKYGFGGSTEEECIKIVEKNRKFLEYKYMINDLEILSLGIHRKEEE